MTDQKRVADRYISRGGGSPVHDQAEFVADLLTVGSFLVWQDEHAMRGGYRPGEAYDAFCRLMNFDRAELTKIIRPEG